MEPFVYTSVLSYLTFLGSEPTFSLGDVQGNLSGSEWQASPSLEFSFGLGCYELGQSVECCCCFTFEKHREESPVAAENAETPGADKSCN